MGFFLKLFLTLLLLLLTYLPHVYAETPESISEEQQRLEKDGWVKTGVDLIPPRLPPYCENNDICNSYINYVRVCQNGSKIKGNLEIRCAGGDLLTANNSFYGSKFESPKCISGSTLKTTLNFDERCNSFPSPPPPNTCTLPTEEQRQKEIVIAQIKEKYKIPITDTNLCGKGGDPICGENTPWTFQEVRAMQLALDELPGCFVNRLNLKGITGRRDDLSGIDGRVQQIMKNKCCAVGGADALYSETDNKVTFCGKKYSTGPMYEGSKTAGGLVGMLIHELTHALQHEKLNSPSQGSPLDVYDNPTVIKFMQATGWRTFCIPTIGCLLPSDTATQYGQTDPLEDMAESTRLYYENPNLLKERSLRRYNFVRDQLMCGKEYQP